MFKDIRGKTAATCSHTTGPAPILTRTTTTALRVIPTHTRVRQGHTIRTVTPAAQIAELIPTSTTPTQILIDRLVGILSPDPKSLHFVQQSSHIARTALDRLNIVPGPNIRRMRGSCIHFKTADDIQASILPYRSEDLSHDSVNMDMS
jgi:hypothetical protein